MFSASASGFSDPFELRQRFTGDLLDVYP